MTSPSTTAGANWPAGTPTLPLSRLSCCMAGDVLQLTVEMPNTPENWAAAGLLGQAGALALPPVAATAPGAATGAATSRSKETLAGGDTPLASKLAGTTGKAATKGATRSGAASSNSRSTRTRGAAATKADAGATADQQRVPETA